MELRTGDMGHRFAWMLGMLWDCSQPQYSVDTSRT